MGSAQGTEKSQPQVVDVDKDRCVNCHACISACPVKFCNDGSGDYVKVDSDTCIGCGNCIKACLHQARHHVDDFGAFMADLGRGVPMVAVVAPSAAANFPDTYMNLVGWLKARGVRAVFDVSFGAELAAKSLVDYIRTGHPKLVIAQPCPAIVTFIQTYHPELLEYLAPIDSPMVHTMKMIRTYYRQYADCRIVAVSPCAAKKREFVETGYGDYNVTLKSLARHFQENGIDLSVEPAGTFEGPMAERAVLFSTPGGLLRTAQRWMPELGERTRTIQGSPVVYQYLRKLPEVLAQGRTPLLVDCLSCEFGCNAGPATLMTEQSPDAIEYWIEKRCQEVTAHYERQAAEVGGSGSEDILRVLSAYHQDGLYARQYADLRGRNRVRIPDERSRWVILSQMHKYSESDLYNCTSCGYLSCEGMAAAIYNGKNKPEHCHFYLAREREITHQEMIDRERRFRNILTTCIEGFVSVDNDFVIVEVNPAFCRMLGAGPDRLVGKALHDLTDEAGKREFDRQHGFRTAGSSNVYEIRLIRGDGKAVDSIFSASPIRDGNGRKVGSFAMVTDVTERKRAEAELRKAHDELEQRVQQRTSELAHANRDLQVEITERVRVEAIRREGETRLRTIMDSIPAGVILVEADTHTIVDVNPAGLAMFGASRDEVIGKVCHRFICPAEEGQCPVTDLARTVENADKVLLEAHGEPRPILKTVVPITLGGRGYLLESFVDISERKCNEIRLEAMLKLYTMREHRITEITDFALESAVAVTNSKIGYLAFLNDDESVLTMYSWSRSAMAECAIVDKPIEYPVHTTGLWGEAVRQRRPIIANDYAAPNPKKKGTPPGHVKVSRHMNIPVFDGDKIVAVAGVGNKVSDYDEADVRQLTLLMNGMWDLIRRRRSQEALEAAKEAAEAATRAKSEFLAMMSHEIRTPMSGVIGMLDVLLDSPQDSEQQTYTQMARDNAEVLLKILEDILDASKIESNKLVLETIPFRPPDVLMQAVETFRGQTEAKGLSLSCTVANDVPALLVGDPKRYRQVLAHLVGNAVKFTDRGGIEVHASCGSQGERDVVLNVSVRDSGVGIEPEVKARLFGKFQQADSSTTRKYGGTGLGLSICKGLVELMGGTIEVESEPGVGSVFRFSARLARYEEGDAVGGTSPVAATVHTGASEGLIVSEPTGPSENASPQESMFDLADDFSEEDLQEIASVFLQETGRRIAEIKEAFEARDTEVLAQAAHTIHSSSQCVRASQLALLGSRIEAMAGRGDWAGVEALIAEVESTFDRLRLQLLGPVGSDPSGDGPR